MGLGCYMTGDAGVCLGGFNQWQLFNRVRPSRGENALTAFCGRGAKHYVDLRYCPELTHVSRT